MSGLLGGLKALGPARLIAMAVVALAVVGLLAMLAVQGSAPPMALLYGDLDLREAGQIVEQLDAQHIAHALAGGGAQIMVPEASVAATRLMLARQNLPSGGSVGYEIFDRGDNLTANQFQQAINETRALEGELARTIQAMAGVRGARVHLVLPKREPFARDRQEAQASIMLTLNGARRLDREGVQAILNLVAAAVPGLRAHDIALIDSRGDVLARAGEPIGADGGTSSGSDLRHATEARLARAVEDMLDRSLGPGHVRAEAAVEFDFSQLHETQEKFDPESKVERSTQTVSDKTSSSEPGATVSVQNNLPNANAGSAAGAGSQGQRQEETNNYEISKTVSTLVREQPQITRVSLAVMVDGTTTTATDGTAVYTPRAADELARIDTLVRSAIGFDAKRGDKVDVVNMRFAIEAADSVPPPRTFLGFVIGTQDVVALAHTALLGLLGLLALLLVLRPMAKHLVALPALAALAGPDAAADMPAADASAIAGATEGQLAIGHDAAAGEDTLVELANVEGQLRGSSVRRIVSLVDLHPEESLAVVRTWMQQPSAAAA